MSNTITVDYLQSMAPDMPIDELKKLAESEGYEITEEEKKKEEEEKPSEQEQEKETHAEKETPDETEHEEEQTATDSEKVSKHVPYERFKQVNDKNKVLEAELAALREARQQPQAIQQPQQQPQQQQVNIEEQIEQMADREVRDKLKLQNIDVDDFTWQVEHPKEYKKYLKETAKVEYRIESEYRELEKTYHDNVAYTNQLKQDPGFTVLFEFAKAELDELPRKKANTIGDAWNRVDQGRGTKEDREIVSKFANECREKMKAAQGFTETLNETKQSEPATAPAPKAGSTNLQALANLPRTSQLSGGATTTLNDAEIQRILDDESIPWEQRKKLLIQKGLLQD